MEITATSAINANKVTMQPAETPPISANTTSQDDVDIFTRTLFGHAGKTPDSVVLDNFYSKSQEVSRAIKGSSSMEQILNNPAEMLASQSKMLRAMIEVDLIAKTAGSVSQGINKITSMQ